MADQRPSLSLGPFHLKKLFIWLCQVSGATHRIFIISHNIFYFGTPTLSSRGLWAQKLWLTSERCGTWLSRSVGCGILVPCPGMGPVFPALQGRFLTTDHLGSPYLDRFSMHFIHKHYYSCFHFNSAFISSFRMFYKESSAVMNMHSLWGHINPHINLCTLKP